MPSGFKVDADKKGWRRPSDYPIALPDGRELVTLKDARHVHHEASKGRAQGCGMAGSHGGADPGCYAWRPDDASQDRRHEDAEHRQAPTAQARQALQDRQMTVFVYVNTSKQVGDADHIKVFANVYAAETWLEENDPEGIVFEYEVL
jgi:hypothetical protein